jgi:hypothetical protein
MYGLKKLYLMMEKQVNRGQDGAGVANIKINVKPCHRYISRYRYVEPEAVSDIFGKIDKKFNFKIPKSLILIVEFSSNEYCFSIESIAAVNNESVVAKQ